MRAPVHRAQANLKLKKGHRTECLWAIYGHPNA